MTTPRIAQLEAIADAPIAINDIIANIARFGPFVIRETDLPKLAKVIIAESRSFPELADQYRRHVLERLLKVVAGALERARERGEASFEDAEITARLIMAPIALASIWTGMFGKDGEAAFDIDGFLSTHAQMLTKALAPEQDT